MYKLEYRPIGMMVRVFANSPGDPRSCHTEEIKIVFDASLLNTQYRKVRIKGRRSNPVWERGSTLTYTLV